MALSLHFIPREVLLGVTDILASEHLPSLHAFALASKFCSSIANSSRFQNIHFEAVAANRLLVHIERWERTHKRNNAYASVHRLSVHGWIPLTENNHASYVETPDLPLYSEKSYPGEDEWTDLGTRYSTILWPGPKPTDLGQMAAWEPLAEFIKRLPGLRVLLWIAYAAFPPCLLHHLYGSIPLPAGYESYEYDLATSPAVSRLAFEMANHQNAAAYTERAIVRMAAGLAPNLTQVYMRYTRQSPLVYDDTQPKPPRALSIETWNDHTPFSHLTTFSLEGNYNSNLLSKLERYDFDSLKSFVLRFIEDPAPDDEDPGSLLSKLPPLESLLIDARWAEQPITIPFEHHGPKLRKLNLCLWRPIQRPGHAPHGDTNEVEIYRALNIPSLTSLTLELDCAALNKDLKSILVNLAVDENLVRSISSTITNSSESSLLQTLRVEVYMNLSPNVGVFYEVMRETIWEVFRAPDGIFVHECLKDKRDSWCKKG
ncbi:hypothetical protein BJX99DRAFT_244237 [Aspergillus californicus]